jgi:cystathionine gamma-synthase
MPRPEVGPATIAARTGIDSDAQFGAVVPPIHMSSNYAFEGYDRPRAHDYSRSGNPTRDHLACALRDLEGGAAATVTATGMAAITTVLQLLQPGDLLLAPHDCYGGTYRLFDAWAGKGAFELEWINFGQANEWQAALDRRPRMVWLETPSNPLLRITDIARVAEAARRGGALVAVDNTFLSPALQQPIPLGADLVVHSTTKYINGHSDVIGGAVIAADADLGERIAWWANCLGVTGGAFDSWLTLRGLRTLEARMAVQQDSTRRIAEYMARHPAVARLHYPGDPGHPGHLTARRQQSGFGAMLGFELVGGEPGVRRFVDGLRHISLAESLGGVESLIAHPATMTHAAMTPAARERAGIRSGLLRLSVGLEAADDLIRDLEAALARAGACADGRGQGHVEP